jgi:hypothetical protein
MNKKKIAEIAERVAIETMEIENKLEKEVDKSKKLSGVDPAIAKFLVESGLEDGDPSDDKISVSKAMMPASSLKPSQTTIRLDFVIGLALSMLKSGKVGGNLGALISSDGHILDGHHRWAGAVLAAGPAAKVGGYQAAMPGKDLIKVLNIMTKGEFGRQKGNAGSGNISDISPPKVRKLLNKYVEDGIRGDYPVSAANVRKILEKSFGSVEAGIDQMAANAKRVSQQVPGWAPARTDMPVIEPDETPSASALLNQGQVNWNHPFVSPDVSDVPAVIASEMLRIARDLMVQDAPPHVQEIVKIIKRAISRMDYFVKYDIDIRERNGEIEVSGGYAPARIPKDSSYMYEDEYDELVADELSRLNKALKIPSSLKKYIRHMQVDIQDKNTVWVDITFKKLPLEGRLDTLKTQYVKEGYDNVTSLFYMIEFNRNTDDREANDWFEKNWYGILKRASKKKTPKGFINPLQVRDMDKWEKSGPDWLHRHNGNVWLGEIAVMIQSDDRPDDEFEKMRDALKKWNHQDLKFEEGVQDKDKIIMSGDTDSKEVEDFLNYLRKDFGNIFDVKIMKRTPYRWSEYILTFTKAN